MPTHHRQTTVDGVPIFYREAGHQDHPAVLLLHGFPTSSFMYRNLIPGLADRWHVIAPDLPGFGFSGAPGVNTFDRLAALIEGFTEALGLNRYAVMIFDYGAPVGLRLALRHPERIAAIMSQNGNAYLEGLSQGWNPIQTYWQNPTEENRKALNGFLHHDSLRWQYTHGQPDETLVPPETWTLDQHMLGQPGNNDIQLDLFLDYQSNVALYPDFQNYFRTHQPPLLAVWGRNDAFFLPPGAEAFRRDNPNAEIHLLDAGHFALETQGSAITEHIRDFLGRVHAHPGPIQAIQADPGQGNVDRVQAYTGPVQTVQAFYAALGQGDVPGIMNLLAPQLSWTETDRFPYYGGTWTTPQDVHDRLLVPVANDWQDFTAVADKFIADGDTVVALGRYAGQARATGQKLDAPFAHVWGVRHGKIISFLQYTDTALVHEALNNRQKQA